jgi:type VI secretion system protein ImpA
LTPANGHPCHDISISISIAMPLIAVDSLLAPLGADSPCGDDLTYDPAFLAVELAAAGKAEQQYGDTVIAGEGPDWRSVWPGALALAERTRDLRVAVWLLRSATALHGLPGAAEGFELIHGLLEQHWPGVYPLLDASENDDPIERVNALMPLAHPAVGLAELRAAGLTGGRGSITLRQVELGLMRAEPRGSEAAPSEAEITQTLIARERAEPGVATSLRRCLTAVTAIERLLDDKVGASANLDLAPLRQMLARALKAVDQVLAGVIAAAPATADAGDATALVVAAGAGSAAVVVSVPGQINNRADALAAIDRICDWYDKNEPSHPAPLLLRRAQRLMEMNFMDIVRDLAPDALHQVRALAGVTDE